MNSAEHEAAPGNADKNVTSYVSPGSDVSVRIELEGSVVNVDKTIVYKIQESAIHLCCYLYFKAKL